MSELVYPKEGLYSYSKVAINRVDECLTRAAKKCIFNIPEGFEYTDYLNELSNTILGLKDKNHAIADETQQTDKFYSDLSDGLTNRITNITIQKLVRRDRMII